MKQQFRGIRPDDLHGRAGLRNPERGFRTEMYFSCIPGEIAGTCSCHSKRNKLDGRSEMPVFQNIDVPGVPHLIRGNRLDGIEFSHAQWQDEIDFLAYDGVSVMQSYCFLNRYDDGRDLPQSKLDDIEAFFAKVRAAGVKLLLRFAYELSPTLTGPTAETTLKHIRQPAEQRRDLRAAMRLCREVRRMAQQLPCVAGRRAVQAGAAGHGAVGPAERPLYNDAISRLEDVGLRNGSDIGVGCVFRHGRRADRPFQRRFHGGAEPRRDVQPRRQPRAEGGGNGLSGAGVEFPSDGRRTVLA